MQSTGKYHCLGLWMLALLILSACVRPQGVVTPPVLPPAGGQAAARRPQAYLPLIQVTHREEAPYPPPQSTAMPRPTATEAAPTSPPTPTHAPTPTPVVLNFCANLPGKALAIPDSDFEGVESLLPVAYDGVLLDLKVRLEIRHSWVGDLEVSLEHAGREISLLQRPGKTAGNPSACPGDDVQALFDDQAPVDAGAACSETSPAILGTVRPREALRTFAGQKVNGDWRLRVRDLSQPDQGALTAWCLVATVQEP